MAAFNTISKSSISILLLNLCLEWWSKEVSTVPRKHNLAPPLPLWLQHNTWHITTTQLGAELLHPMIPVSRITKTQMLYNSLSVPASLTISTKNSIQPSFLPRQIPIGFDTHHVLRTTAMTSKTRIPINAVGWDMGVEYKAPWVACFSPADLIPRNGHGQCMGIHFWNGLHVMEDNAQYLYEGLGIWEKSQWISEEWWSDPRELILQSVVNHFATKVYTQELTVLPIEDLAEYSVSYVKTRRSPFCLASGYLATGIVRWCPSNNIEFLSRWFLERKDYWQETESCCFWRTTLQLINDIQMLACVFGSRGCYCLSLAARHLIPPTMRHDLWLGSGVGAQFIEYLYCSMGSFWVGTETYSRFLWGQRAMDLWGEHSCLLACFVFFVSYKFVSFTCGWY